MIMKQSTNKTKIGVILSLTLVLSMFTVTIPAVIAQQKTANITGHLLQQIN